MVSEKKSFCVEIYTPSGSVCKTDAVSLVFPGVDGDIGILSGRSPLVAMLGAGRMRVQAPNGKEYAFFVAGGFAHVRDNAVTLLTEECLTVEEIDYEEAWEALQQAQALPIDTDEQLRDRDQALAVARKRFNLVQEYRRRTLGERD